MYIKIEAHNNGGHANQSGGLVTQDGWVTIPDNISIPNTFPFVDIVIENGEVTQLSPQTIQAEDFTNISSEDYESWKAKIDFFLIRNHITQEEHDNLISALDNAVGRE